LNNAAGTSKVRRKRKSLFNDLGSFKRKNLCIPYAVFLAIFVIIPIAIIFLYAFTSTDTDGHLYFSLDSFTSFFTSTTKLNVLVVSLFIGLLNTVICLLIAYPISLLLSNKKFNKSYVLVLLFIMPMWINFVLRTGATRDVLTWLGMNGGDHPYVATMIGLVYNYLPFCILPLYTTMIKMDKAQIEAARDLGCNEFQTFYKSVLPQSVPGIVSAAEMVFMPTMSSYVISDTLSEGKITLFGNFIYLDFTQNLLNDGSFMATVMLILVFVTMIISKKFGKEKEVRGGGLW